MAKARAVQKNAKPIVMYCTGGIRCEKASAYLIQNLGFKEVYQLDGGILKYFEEVGRDHFEGECFVFDKRVCLDENLEETGTVQCYACRTVLPLHEFKRPALSTTQAMSALRCSLNLAMHSRHPKRFIDTAQYRVEAFPLAKEKAWVLFVYVFQKSLAEEKAWLDLCQTLRCEFSEKLCGEELPYIGGAFKSPKESYPLSPQFKQARDEWVVCEDDALYVLQLENTLNPGLFIDQRLSRQHLGAFCKARSQKGLETRVLNLFSYTGSFSLVAALAGAQTTSIDTHDAYLQWQALNFSMNELKDQGKRIREDARRYVERLAKRQQKFDAIILDPPSFSRQGKQNLSSGARLRRFD